MTSVQPGEKSIPKKPIIPLDPATKKIINQFVCWAAQTSNDEFQKHYKDVAEKHASVFLHFYAKKNQKAPQRQNIPPKYNEIKNIETYFKQINQYLKDEN